MRGPATASGLHAVVTGCLHEPGLHSVSPTWHQLPGAFLPTVYQAVDLVLVRKYPKETARSALMELALHRQMRPDQQECHTGVISQGAQEGHME